MASLFWLDEELCSDVYLDGIVTVFDAKYGLQELRRDNEPEAGTTVNAALKQVALSDVILLNKVDLVTDTSGVADVLKQVNAACPVIKTQRGRVNLDAVLDLHAYDGQGDSGKNKFDASNGTNAVHLDVRVGTVTLRVDAPVPRQALEKFLEQLLWEKEEFSTELEVMRLKGLVWLAGEEWPLMIQGVHDTYDTYVVKTGIEDKTPGATIVVIGRNLDALALQQSLERIAVS